MMRRILVDHARARLAAKRSPGELLNDAAPLEDLRLDTLALDQALQRLASKRPPGTVARTMINIHVGAWRQSADCRWCGRSGFREMRLQATGEKAVQPSV